MKDKSEVKVWKNKEGILVSKDSAWWILENQRFGPCFDKEDLNRDSRKGKSGDSSFLLPGEFLDPKEEVFREREDCRERDTREKHGNFFYCFREKKENSQFTGF